MNRVLVVDDSLTVRMDIGDALADADLDAIPCADLASARLALAAGGVCLVVLDILLPDGDGLDLLRELRQNPATMRIPVLLLSNESEVRSRMLGIDAGADEYIGKPYDLGQLVARALALLQPETRDPARVGHRVLVIDDSATFRHELGAALALAGYRVRGAVSGEEGLTLATVERPDAVIVDGVLPGIDGATVIRRLKSDAALRGTPCLLLTAVEGTADELRALEAGADAYVRKSDDLALILARLAALVRDVSPSDGMTPSLLAPKRLLVVDDSPAHRHELGRQLRQDGYDVVLAPGGQDALDLLTVQPVDCILLDTRMPGLSGEDTCRRIKQGVEWRHIPLIMMDERNDQAAMLAGINAGADDFVGKSADLEVLKARLRAQLRRRHFEDENRRAREQALRKDTETRFLRLVQSNIIGVIFGDATGGLTEANDAFLTMIGRTRAELGANALRLSELAPPDRRERMMSTFAQLRRDGKANPFETELTRPDGERLPIVLGLVLMDGSDMIVGFVLDRTEQKLAEAQLHRYTAALAEANRELRAARDAAEALARAKADFLASMSHEIRTPMNAVIGMAGLLGDTALTDVQREFVDTIRTSGEHLLTVIGNILDFSKLESTRVELERQPFDLRACVEEALELVALRVSEKGLDLTHIDDPRIPRAIVGDVGRMRQLLVNLLGNAVKFTDRGEIVVESSLVRTVDAVLEIRVEVRDTGIGLDDQQRGRLFQPFMQAETSTTRKYGGTGLGLSICKQIAEAMRGDIGVDSSPGQGSSFWFTFRAEPAETDPAATAAEPARLRGRRVLIVDDNASVRRHLHRQTEQWGMHPHATSSPRAALDRLQAGDDFDVALVDHHMPEMTGVALVRELRRTHPADRLPIVFMSAAGAARRAVEDERIDVQGILSKPLRHAPLRDALLTAVDRRTPQLRQRPASPAPTRLEHRLRILLAEDNPFNQRVAKLMLGKLEQQVTIVSNGHEVLAALARETFDVVLMDVQMPEMDGVTATREIRARLPESRRPRIIAMTANALVGDRERYLADGMDDYVSKPIRDHDLLRVLLACRPLP